MILWTWKEHPETRGDDAHVWPCKAFRWALIASGSVEGMTVEIAHQHQRRDTGEWGTSHTSAYGVSVNRGWSWGVRHAYYDGPHCSLSLGLLHVFWGGDPRTGWCRKCMPE